MIEPNLCIYHANCADGFSAAWVVYQKWPKCEFFASGYETPPPDVKDKHVIIVDFSYKKNVLVELAKQAKSIVILDHHATAKNELQDFRVLDNKENADNFTLLNEQSGCVSENVSCRFDMKHAGAVLTWRWCFPDKIIPLLLLYVEDRDLWKFKLENSKEINAALTLRDKTWKDWSNLNYDVLNNRNSVIVEGSTVIKIQDNYVKLKLKGPFRHIKLADKFVPALNSDFCISELGNALARHVAFAVVYCDVGDKRLFSLRSIDSGSDVSEIAKMYGGGGHKHAAGFYKPCNWWGEEYSAGDLEHVY